MTVPALLLCVCLCAGAAAESAVDWKQCMNLPSLREQLSYRTEDVAPYIVFCPEFNGSNRYCEYAVDFRAEYLPNATYVAIADWRIESDQLNRQYKSVWQDYGNGGYCGFQALEDGTRVAILTIWDKFCMDSDGHGTVYRPNQVYPANDAYAERVINGAEGTFLHSHIPYLWKENHDYRALLRLANNEGGNARLLFSVCDLETNEWTLLAIYELGYGEAYMGNFMMFFENYLPQYAGRVRTLLIRNCRVRERNGRWIPARSGYFLQNFSHPGSYNYGARGDSYWVITCGIPGLCRLPADGARYSVTYAESGSPY